MQVLNFMIFNCVTEEGLELTVLLLLFFCLFFFSFHILNWPEMLNHVCAM